LESVAIRAARSQFSALFLHASARWIIVRHGSFWGRTSRAAV